MPHRQGFTLMEMVIVLIIIGVVIAIAFPNFTGPTEQARALNAQNNLLAIYSAEKNYNNNNGSFCLSSCGSSLANLNTNLSLNIQDDGSYSYVCTTDPSGTPFLCTATRKISSTLSIAVIDEPIQLNPSNSNPNPKCTPASSTYSSWCPN